MTRTFATAILSLVMGVYSPFAVAGVYTDDLGRCLVKSSSADDQILLVQWMFSAFSLHPAVQPLASLNAEQRDIFNRKTAELLQRLLINDCRNEAIVALKYEGPSAMETGFKTLGEVAARGLTTDPRVGQALQGFTIYLDKDKMAELANAVGLPSTNAPTGPPNQ